MRKELDIIPLISTKQIAGGSGQRNLYCPVCACINTHIKPPHLIIDEKWQGNGALAVTPVWSECGSEWEICIGEHKGDAPIFARITKSCKNNFE
ncbi:MAG: hypothetical protein RR068_07125 [Hafnia sp.]